MTQQISARFHEGDVIDTLRVVVGANIEVELTPPCSCCNAVIGYARDQHALWLFPQLWPTSLPLGTLNASDEAITKALVHEPRVVGFETLEELETFLTKLKDKGHYDVCAPILRAAFNNWTDR